MNFNYSTAPRVSGGVIHTTIHTAQCKFSTLVQRILQKYIYIQLQTQHKSTVQMLTAQHYSNVNNKITVQMPTAQHYSSANSRIMIPKHAAYNPTEM